MILDRDDAAAAHSAGVRAKEVMQRVDQLRDGSKFWCSIKQDPRDRKAGLRAARVEPSAIVPLTGQWV
jgi:hypothetical protein